MTAKQESSSLDWNDLHVEFGLDVVRQQLLAAAANEPPVRTAGLPDTPADEAPDLPPAPSDDSAGEAAPPTEGAGENGWTLDKARVRFALVEGTTSAFDLYRKAIIKKAAFLAMVGKALGNECMTCPTRRALIMTMPASSRRMPSWASACGKAVRRVSPAIRTGAMCTWTARRISMTASCVSVCRLQR